MEEIFFGLGIFLLEEINIDLLFILLVIFLLLMKFFFILIDIVNVDEEGEDL